MKVSYNWLQTYFSEKLPSPEKLAELLTFHAFEIEGMERPEPDIDDVVLDVKVLPDRAHYALSHRGIALEVSLASKIPLKTRGTSNIGGDITDKPVIRIENKKRPFCRRYVGRFVDLGHEEGHSPKWLSEALASIGQRSINPIVDATNYVMYDIGQPLHAFDADKIKGDIVIRAAKEGETIELLPERVVVDGREIFKERRIILTTNDHVIADDDGPLVIAGIKGGRRAEVSPSTRRIIIESANFDPSIVRKTSTKFDLRSDSSKRFENEITPELAIHAMDNVCALVKEIAPKAKFGPIVDEYPVKAEKTVIEIDPNYINERLGVKVPVKEAKDILSRMNISVVESKDKWILTVPFERLDLCIKEDIVEEVGRVYGYDKIEGRLPPGNDSKITVMPTFYLSEKIKNILVGEGFSEVHLYSLVSRGEIETAKPLARDKAFARTNLAEGVAECVKKNALNADLLGLEAIKIFEIGHVFFNDSEHINLVIGAEQIKKVKGLKGENLIKRAIDAMSIELSKITGTDPLNAPIETNGAVSTVEISIDRLASSFKDDVKSPFSYEDLGFTHASGNKYKKFSLYPSVVRDVALFAPESIDAEKIWAVIEGAISDAKATNLLARYSLFDVFKKDGKTSYAFRLVFQAMDRTLVDSEVNKIMESVYSAIKGKGWETR